MCVETHYIAAPRVLSADKNGNAYGRVGTRLCGDAYIPAVRTRYYHKPLF